MKNINTALLDNARTSIFIAHRLKTVVESGLPFFPSYSLFALFDTHFFFLSYILFFADLIIVLNEGQVVEQGTHHELLEMKGLYYRMWVDQRSHPMRVTAL